MRAPVVVPAAAAAVVLAGSVLGAHGLLAQDDAGIVRGAKTNALIERGSAQPIRVVGTANDLTGWPNAGPEGPVAEPLTPPGDVQEGARAPADGDTAPSPEMRAASIGVSQILEQAAVRVPSEKTGSAVIEAPLQAGSPVNTNARSETPSDAPLHRPTGEGTAPQSQTATTNAPAQAAEPAPAPPRSAPVPGVPVRHPRRASGEVLTVAKIPVTADEGPRFDAEPLVIAANLPRPHPHRRARPSATAAEAASPSRQANRSGTEGDDQEPTLGVATPAASEAAEAGEGGEASPASGATEAAQAKPARPFSGTEPYKLMRMMNALQDDIARGSGAALAAQRVLSRRIAEEVRAAPASLWQARKNASALLAYTLSGGEPAIVDHVLSAHTFPEPFDAALRGALAYVEGRAEDARRHFGRLDLDDLPEAVKGQLLLALAGLAVDSDPQAAMRNLERARYVAPGTLIEEAALRRGVLLAAETDEDVAFERLADRYMRKFRTSVYAGNFRKRLAAGLTRMSFIEEQDAFERLERITEPMSEAGQQELFLLVARAAMENGSELASRLAAERALRTAEPGSLDHRRAKLYKAAAEVVDPERYGAAMQTLRTMDATRLPEDDRALHRAAMRLVETVADLPEPSLASPASQDAQAGGEAAPMADEAAAAPAQEPANVAPVEAEPAAAGASEPAAAPARDALAEPEVEARDGEGPFGAPSEIEERVAEALASVDELLGNAR